MIATSKRRPDMIENRAFKVVITCVLAAWFIITCLALSGMYRLWWERERVLYWGQSTETQRAVVFERAGLPPGVLSSLAELNHKWPLTSHYQVKGDHNTLSYLTYLLIPRIPSGQGEYVLEAGHGNLDLHEELEAKLAEFTGKPASAVFSTGFYRC